MILAGSGSDPIGGRLYIDNGRHGGGGGDIDALSKVTAHLSVVDGPTARTHLVLNTQILRIP